jgi:hypothetical protein
MLINVNSCRGMVLFATFVSESIEYVTPPLFPEHIDRCSILPDRPGRSAAGVGLEDV